MNTEHWKQKYHTITFSLKILINIDTTSFYITALFYVVKPKYTQLQYQKITKGEHFWLEFGIHANVNLWDDVGSTALTKKK